MKKIYMLRVLLIVITLAMMATVFLFSAQEGNDSASSSSAVADVIRGIFCPNFDSLDPADQAEINYTLTVIVRKGAHMTEYAALAVLALLNCVAWNIPKRYILKLTVALFFAVLYAVTDELHQLFVPGRAGLFTDVLIDSAGAMIGLGIATGVIFLVDRRKAKKTVR